MVLLFSNIKDWGSGKEIYDASPHTNFDAKLIINFKKIKYITYCKI